MNFKHSCFIENSPEMREWLEGLGYKPNYMYHEDGVLYTSNNDQYYVGLIRNIQDKDIIDCRNNPDLFKAITAMRDDSDYMQWFKRLCTGELYLCRAKNFDRIRNFRHKSKDGWEYHNGLYRKATLEELIEHFK